LPEKVLRFPEYDSLRVIPAAFFCNQLQCLLILFYIKEGASMKTFSEKAYDLLRKVPKGRVTTYKEIAHALGSRSYRGVGQAMKKNPYAPEVP
jgi:O6-methylguanine-DNA--protein-cysteine methyltransferase